MPLKHTHTSLDAYRDNKEEWGRDGMKRRTGSVLITRTICSRRLTDS